MRHQRGLEHLLDTAEFLEAALLISAYLAVHGERIADRAKLLAAQLQLIDVRGVSREVVALVGIGAEVEQPLREPDVVHVLPVPAADHEPPLAEFAEWYSENTVRSS